MASLVTNFGLQRIGINASQATAYSASRYIRTMAVDDQAGAFAASHDQLNDVGAVTNEYDQAFDATPTRSSQTITHTMTIPVGSGNFTIRRISLHDDTAANVTTSSTTLCVGIDGQALTKTSDFTLQFTVNLIYTSI